MNRKKTETCNDMLQTGLKHTYAEEAKDQGSSLTIPEDSDDCRRKAEQKALRRQKWKRILRKPYSDYFVLQMVTFGNMGHFLFMLILTLFKRRSYRYFALHVNIPDGGARFLKLLLLFLLPTLLTWVFAVLFRLMERKKKIWRKLIRAAAGIVLTVVCIVALVQSMVFEPTFPLASYTARPKNIGQYDRIVQSSLPSTNCPDLTRSIPENAQDVEFEYWYIQIMDYEWTIHVAYTLPEADYRELQNSIVAQFDAMSDIQVTENDGAVTYDTVDYRKNLSRANTKVAVTFEDELCRIDYTLTCFLYEGYIIE